MADFSRNVLSSSSVVVAVLFFLLLSLIEARDYLVGAKTDSWKVPSSESDSLNRWAEKSRFLIGDSLVWKYDGKTDSVLEVSKRDYATCNTSSPITVHNDGNTKIVLDHSGAYYFISGAKGHCEQGQKLIVVTLSEKHMSRFFMGAPAPSPVESEGPAMAPTSNAATLKASLVVALGVLIGFLF
ncbi:hypothetical protein K7X08_027348 [Anisodus acutangulus]|uniref:Phytocyanin domain-containing protein n=1 Tax=Anisodus acutangulus TaxID=402998 RepID=A0A9Q1MJ17_9SOLA|nr:hypothetical protein K7X08_027348 [Anisodus acutangulus]